MVGDQNMSQEKESIWTVAKPYKPERAWVKIEGDIAIIKLENGGMAVVSKTEICKLAERFNLVYENYSCKK